MSFERSRAERLVVVVVVYVDVVAAGGLDGLVELFKGVAFASDFRNAGRAATWATVGSLKMKCQKMSAGCTGVSTKIWLQGQ